MILYRLYYFDPRTKSMRYISDENILYTEEAHRFYEQWNQRQCPSGLIFKFDRLVFQTNSIDQLKRRCRRITIVRGPKEIELLEQKLKNKVKI